MIFCWFACFVYKSQCGIVVVYSFSQLTKQFQFQNLYKTHKVTKNWSSNCALIEEIISRFVQLYKNGIFIALSFLQTVVRKYEIVRTLDVPDFIFFTWCFDERDWNHEVKKPTAKCFLFVFPSLNQVNRVTPLQQTRGGDWWEGRWSRSGCKNNVLW